MKHKILFTLGFMACGMFAAVPAGAVIAPPQPSEAGPYYALPSWDQQLQCEAPASCPRFIILSNWGKAAVLDKETGLVWQRSPSTTSFSWESAQDHCNNLKTGNRMGWRLPTLQELLSLEDPAVASPGPTLPNGNPFANVQSTSSSAYWSATTLAANTAAGWGVSF
jgi:hypothetical protein